MRMYATIGLLAAVVAGVLLIPLPATVMCSLEVRPRGAESVYVKVPGTLKWAVESGAKVETGDELARLKNIDVELAIRKLEGQIDVYREQLAGLSVVSLSDDRAAARMAEIEKEIEAAEGQLTELRLDAQRLTIVAPRAGTVIPPSLIADRSSDRELKKWSGTPLDAENLGAVLDRLTKLCEIGDPTVLEADLAIDQADVELVSEGQTVEVMLNQSADYVYVSHVEQKAGEAMKASPERLSSQAGGDIPTMADSSGVPRPLTPHFHAVVPLPRDDGRGVLRVGLVGRAKIHIKPRTIGDRLLRYFQRTFNFEL
jgi:putative peptide zinc metalloprotease protein